MNIPKTAMYESMVSDEPEDTFFLIYLFTVKGENSDETFPAGYMADSDGKQVSDVGYLNDFMVMSPEHEWAETGNKIQERVFSNEEVQNALQKWNLSKPVE